MVPYVQQCEFEGLLFANVDAFSSSISVPALHRKRVTARES